MITGHVCKWYLFLFGNWIQIGLAISYLPPPCVLSSHTQTLVSTSLFIKTFESPQSRDSVLERPLGLWLNWKQSRGSQLTCLCIAVSHHCATGVYVCVFDIYQAEILKRVRGVSREETERGGERETWTQTEEVKQHSPQLELIRSTSAQYLSVCISQLNSTPLNHVNLNMVEIHFQSEVLCLYSLWFYALQIHFGQDKTRNTKTCVRWVIKILHSLILDYKNIICVGVRNTVIRCSISLSSASGNM